MSEICFLWQTSSILLPLIHLFKDSKLDETLMILVGKLGRCSSREPDENKSER